MNSVVVRLQQAQAVVLRTHRKCCRQLPRTRKQILLPTGLWSTLTEDLQPRNRLGGPDKNSGSITGSVRNHVQHPVNAIVEVNVGVARRAEHRHVLHLGLAERVRRWIVRTSISFYLDYPSFQVAPLQPPTQQCRGGLQDVLG